jgi:hypothetical protein
MAVSSRRGDAEEVGEGELLKEIARKPKSHRFRWLWFGIVLEPLTGLEPVTC